MNRFHKRVRGAGMIAIAVLAPLLLVQPVKAFSLLGPYADWMVETNDYRQSGDIGGPMDINEEYRWNVPTVTYGFDKSFLDYFGSNGVAAVESAIQILNDLPAASDIVVSNYPLSAERLNDVAANEYLYDLKSAVLALLVERLGLGQPVRNILDIRKWDPALLQERFCGDDTCSDLVNFPGFVIQRNFDPETLAPSFAVDDAAYSCGFYTNAPLDLNYVYPFSISTDPNVATAVADSFDSLNPGLHPGVFYVGLSRDDVGGLRYLLSATNVNWESLPKNVLFIGKQHHANKRLRGAWRPGVEKITFVPHPLNKRGKFKTLVFKYAATYVTNGVVSEQPVKRIVSKPDILFSVAETFPADPASPMFLRTGTSNWVNNASENGSSTNDGPGVITSPIKITFDELGPHVLSGAIYTPAVVNNSGWASFDLSTNPPVLYPQNTGQNRLLVRLHLFESDTNLYHEITNSLFRVTLPFGGQADLQVSTNKTDWTSLATVMNSGSIVRWDYFGPEVPVSFRVIPTGL